MAVIVRAQNLRKAVTILKPTLDPNKYGDASRQTFTPLETVYAEVLPLTGRQLVEARQIHSEVSHRVTIRPLKGVTTAGRVEWQGRLLEIESVLNIEERDTMLVLWCKELPNG